MNGDVPSFCFFELCKQSADLFDRIRTTGECCPQDCTNTDGIIINPLGNGLRGDCVAVWLHRDDPRFDIEILSELVPTDVDICSENNIRFIVGLALSLAALLPGPLMRE